MPANILSTRSTNYNAMYGMQNTRGQMADSSQELYSGERLTSAGKDVAALITTNSLEKEISAEKTVLKVTQRVSGMLSTADSAINVIQGKLRDLRDIASQLASGQSKGATQSYQLSAQKTMDAIKDVAANTEFDGVNVLDGAHAAKFEEVGAQPEPGQTGGEHPAGQGAQPAGQAAKKQYTLLNKGKLTANGTAISIMTSPSTDSFKDFYLGDLTLKTLFGDDTATKVDLSDQAKAKNSIAVVDEALQKVELQIALLGAQQKEIEDVDKLTESSISEESNLASSLSDTDYTDSPEQLAQEKLRFTAAGDTRGLWLRQTAESVKGMLNAAAAA